MASIDDQLAAWQKAGVVTPEVAEAIRRFEASRTPVPGTTNQRISVLEAMVYLGLAVGGVGVAVLVALAWPDMAWPVRAAVFGVPAVLAFTAGQFFRTTSSAALQRAATVAWLACVALVAATVSTVAMGLNASGENATVAGCLVATAAGVALWRLEPRSPQVVGIVGALIGVVIGVVARPSVDDPIAGGLGIAAVGLVAIVLGEFHLALPLAAWRVCGALSTAVGSWIITGQTGATEVVGPAVAVCLITLAVRRNSLAYIAAGVGLLFISLVMTVAVHVADPAGVAVALITCGLALIGAVVVLVKFRPWMAEPGAGRPT
jgi:hypothetical protein